ncbi:hypothetical protein F5Y16DRAFT_384108 [Xylariaceae sp. FL0255]|nr:hypothetical protein F5Y16DRAFT_384108 [Xylariaceae sp. FL0255]
MSDPVSLALGITPLVLSVLQGIKATRSRLKTLRNHDRVMQRLRRTFTTQSHIFLDECHLLLQQIVDPDDVVFMLENDQSTLWNEPTLDQKIRDYLGRKFDDVKEIMQDIQVQIKSLDERLNRTLDTSRELKLTKTEKAREAFDVMAHKTDFEADIEHLKELNQEFKRLRKMAHQVKKAQALVKTQELKQMPKVYKMKGEHARSLYNAMKYCWSCSEGHIAQHYMALVLEFTDGFDMRIILHRPQSQLIDLSIRPEQLHSHMQPPAAKRVKLDSENCVRKKSIDLRRSQSVCGTLTQMNTKSLDSCFIDTPDSFRHALMAYGQSKNKPEVTAVPLLNILRKSLDADLTVPQQLRLVLKIARAHLLFHWTPWWRQYWTLSDLFYFEETGNNYDITACLKTLHLGTRLDFGSDHYSIDDEMSDQTKQYSQHNSMNSGNDNHSNSHIISTPATDNDDIDSGYHSNTTSEKAEGCYSNTTNTEIINPPELEEALLNHGIRNLSLYCLGVALLQIGRWNATLNLDDVVTVRKLAAVNNRLGPRFQMLTQKCIECDFGHGFDLGNTQLQGAIYSSVICELEHVIHLLGEDIR